MSFSLDSIKRYKFKLVYDVIDVTKPWEYQLFRSSMDDYNDDGLLSYQVISIGVDSNGFFYKYYTYDYDLSGVSHSSGPYKVNLTNVLSGTFEIEFSPYAYFTTPSIPDEYEDLFELLDKPVIINSQKHVTVSCYYSSVYLMVQILPTDGYQFIDDDIIMDFKIYGSELLEDVTPFIHTDINSPTELLFHIDLGVVGVPTNYLTDGAYEYYLNFVNVYKNPLDISESYIGCSGSNTASTIANGGTYTNVLTANTGYLMDGADIHVYMDDIELDINTVYDSGTHTITVVNVTGDLIVTVSAVKEHTFRFFSADGNTLYLSYTGVSITSLKLSISGTQRTLIINGTTNTYIAIIPSGFSLKGLSFSVNPTRYDIPIDIDYTNPITTDTDFYETILENEIIPTSFTLNLYSNKAEKVRVDKTNYLTPIATLDGTLRNSVQITHPTIRIEYSGVPTFNYVYIPQFERYYYVDDIVSVSKDIWDIILSVDVLMSFKDVIRSQYAFIERNQYTFNPDIEDKNRSYENKPEIEYIELPENIFNVTQSGTTLSGVDKALRFVITVVGKDD